MTGGQTPTFVPIVEADFAELAGYLTTKAPAGEAVAREAMPAERRLRWLLLENPVREADVPLGWTVRTAEDGRIVGALVCVPFRVGIGGVTTTAVMSCKFFVDEAFRGVGVAPFRAYLKLGRRFPLFCTSANAASGELFRGAGAYVVGGSDHAMLLVARHGPVVEEWVYRRIGRRGGMARVLAGPAWLKPRRRSPVGSSQGVLRKLSSAEEATALAVPATIATAVAVVRDEAYLRWRYFPGDSRKDVYAFTAPGAAARLVVVNQVSSGHRGQIRVLNVLDVWPPLDAGSAGAFASALHQRYDGQFDVMWLRAQSAEVEEGLSRDAGFIRHAFPAPLAWCVDPTPFLPTRDWYLVPGESE